MPWIFPKGYAYVENLKWTSTVTNRLLLEAGYSAHGYENGGNQPQPGTLRERGTPEWYANAARIDLVLGTQTTAGGSGSCCIFWPQPARVLQPLSLTPVLELPLLLDGFEIPTNRAGTLGAGVEKCNTTGETEFWRAIVCRR